MIEMYQSGELGEMIEKVSSRTTKTESKKETEPINSRFPYSYFLFCCLSVTEQAKADMV